MATPKKNSAKKDDKPKKTSHKKGKDIKPLHEDQLKKQMKKDSKETAQANADMLEELAKKVESQEETVSKQEQTIVKTSEELVLVKSELTKKRGDVTSAGVISDTGKSTLCWTSCKQMLVLIAQKYSRPLYYCG